ncbi:MAG: S-methyl-5'-thioadenosine phosphorylase [Candidatus Nezhaarchaeota archaeon]|nr:S-methyl-5'-thioadenosine phosphorylase [Candidatus Nezhaarchaeota archaeon]
MQVEKADIGIIGGSGLYDLSLFGSPQELKVYTPYGPTSDSVFLAEYKGKRIAFIPRHGRGHRIPPHKINYRANMWALKELGVKRVVAVSAVGSLREDYRPGDIVVVDQFIDFTKGREYTFYDGNLVCHVSLADPFCPQLRDLAIRILADLNVSFHDRGTYVCIEGPRFSTRAESRLFRSWNADVIGMTLVPEVNLAREAEMCYLAVTLVTDYDVWAPRHVTAEEVSRVMSENIDKAKRLLSVLIPQIPAEGTCKCGAALKEALV